MCTEVHLLFVSFLTMIRLADPITNLSNAVYFPPYGTKFIAIRRKRGRPVYCNVLRRK